MHSSVTNLCLRHLLMVIIDTFRVDMTARGALHRQSPLVSSLSSSRPSHSMSFLVVTLTPIHLEYRSTTFSKRMVVRLPSSKFIQIRVYRTCTSPRIPATLLLHICQSPTMQTITFTSGIPTHKHTKKSSLLRISSPSLSPPEAEALRSLMCRLRC